MGKKANLVVESVLAALIRDVGPHRFAIALNNVCCHGQVFTESNLDLAFNDDEEEDDSMLQSWFSGIERLIEVGNWMVDGPKPKFLCDPRKEDRDHLMSIVNRPAWVVKTNEIAALVYEVLNIDIDIMDEDANADHRFNSLTKEAFIRGLEKLLEDGGRFYDLCNYLDTNAGLTISRKGHGNKILRNFRRPVKIVPDARWKITAEELAEIIHNNTGINLTFVLCPAESEIVFTTLEHDEFVDALDNLVVNGARISDLCAYIYKVAELECVISRTGLRMRGDVTLRHALRLAGLAKVAK